MAQLQWGHWGSCTTQGSPASLPRESVSEGGDGSSVPQERLKPAYLESIPGEMKLYSQFLGKRPWFAGEKVRGMLWGMGVVISPSFRVRCSFVLCPS